MWKLYFCRISLLLLPIHSYSQTSDSNQANANNPHWNVLIENKADIFRFRDTTRWMIRWDAAAIASPLNKATLNLSDLDLSFEILALKNWSVGVNAAIASSFENQSQYVTYPDWQFGIEIRNYIRKSEHGPNLNGWYWGLETTSGKRNILIDQSIQFQGYRATGRVGFQALLSKHFFADLSLGVGADYTVLDQYTSTFVTESPEIKVITTLGWRPIIDPQIKLGWAISRPRPSATRKDLWLLGQSAKTIQYKIDLFGLFNHQLSGISSSLEMEKAFGQSGFTVNFGLGGEWHRPDYITGADLDQMYVEKFNQLSWRISAEPRWYYNIRKRLNKNLTNSVFNGNFLSLLFGHQQVTYHNNFDHLPYSQPRKRLTRKGAELCWGMQRTFFNVAFAEFRLGGSAMLEKSILENGDTASLLNIDAVADVKIGLTF